MINIDIRSKTIILTALFTFSSVLFLRLQKAVVVNLTSLQYLSWTQGLRESDKSPSLPADYPRTASWQVLDAIARGDSQDALNLVEPLVSAQDPYALQLKALILEQTGDVIGAIDNWRQTGSAFQLKRLAQTLTGSGNHDDALLAYRALVEIAPEEGVYSLAIFLRDKLSDYDATEELLREKLAAYPESRRRSAWLDLIAHNFTKQQKWLPAAEIFRLAIAENPDDWRAHRGLGWAYYNAGLGYTTALGEFQKVIEIDPSNGEGFLAIGILYAREERFDVADGWFQEALEREPDRLDWLLTRAGNAKNSGDISQSIDLYQQLLSRDPNSHEAHFNIAWIYVSLERIEEAIVVIEKALTIEPNEVSYYLRAGQIYEIAGNNEQALSAYRQALNLDSSNKTTKTALQLLNERLFPETP